LERAEGVRRLAVYGGGGLFGCDPGDGGCDGAPPGGGGRMPG